MRRITRCLGCSNVVGVYKSYKAHIKETVKSPLTGEIKEVEYIGRLCKSCSITAGYKARKQKKEGLV